MTTIDQIALQCYGKSGMFPISFCLPRQKIRPFRAKEKEKELSFIIPGVSGTFVFTDEESYMNEYQTSKFARTKKKGGWDCVRHLEIMAASSLPLFEDIGSCPEYTMIHYPKHLFSAINESFGEMSDSDYNRMQEQIYTWLTEHLASNRMVDYLLRMSDNLGAKNILFIDKSLPLKPDCESAMILGGLKNKFGATCEVAYPLECLYSGKPVPSKPKWWKTNFNIYGILDDTLRSPNEKRCNLNTIIANIRSKAYDVIIYGSMSRSLALFRLAAEYYPKKRIICINGDDDNMLGAPKRPTFFKGVKAMLREGARRDRKYEGFPAVPFSDNHSRWKNLSAAIMPHCTLFMRELALRPDVAAK